MYLFLYQITLEEMHKTTARKKQLILSTRKVILKFRLLPPKIHSMKTVALLKVSVIPPITTKIVKLAKKKEIF